jgi:LuxR family transcriptional regulator, maltose regulon positive regulatory protein
MMSSGDFQLPAGPRSLFRERLVRPILGSSQPICLIQAPPGYGKSVLLQQIGTDLSHAHIPHRWAFSGVRDSGLLDHNDPSAQYLLIDGPEQFGDQETERALALIQSFGLSRKIVITTRQPRVARAIAARFLGRTVCYTSRDLMFSRSESAQLLRSVSLGPEALAQAYEWSAGWPLALALIESDRLQSASPLAHELDLEEPTEQAHRFFASKVLAEIGEPLRSFLLTCGDFAELDGRILQETDALVPACTLLERLYDCGLFAEKVEGRAHLYRLPPRFRAFLEDYRAAHGQAPGTTFHSSVSAKFAAAGSNVAALHHAYRSGDKALLAALLNRLGPFRIILSQAYSAQKYFRALPDSLANAYPMISLARIYLLHIGDTPYFARDRLVKFLNSEVMQQDRRVALHARLIDFISRIHEDRVATLAEIEHCEREYADVLAEDTIAQTIFYRLAALARYEADQIRESMVLSERVMQLSLEQELPFIASFSSLQHAMSHLKLGDLAGADNLLSKSFENALERFGPESHLSALIGVVLARIAVERLDLQRAAGLIKIHLSQIELRPAWLFNSAEAAFTAAAFCYYEANGAEATLEYLYRKREIFRIGGLHRGDVTLAMLQVRALFRGGHIEAARAHLGDEPLASVLALPAPARSGRLPLSLFANVLLCDELVRSQESKPKSPSRLEELEDVAQQTQDVILSVSCRIARVLRCLRESDLEGAHTALFYVVRQCARFDIARPIYENWRYLAPMLGPKDLPFLSQREVAFLQKIRDLADDAQETVAVSADGVGLSARERQILLFLAEGYSSKEMARVLNIAMGTVKGYRRTLYEKLHIFTRSEAVAAARRLGLAAPRLSSPNTEVAGVSRDTSRPR